MYTVTPKKGEDISFTLKRLKNKVLADGLMEDLYSRRAFENPREKKKRKLRLRFKKMKLAQKQY
jgi:small subunit ribosomal protein S21